MRNKLISAKEKKGTINNCYDNYLVFNIIKSINNEKN
jgi:hypothetical protein